MSSKIHKMKLRGQHVKALYTYAYRYVRVREKAEPYIRHVSMARRDWQRADNILLGLPARITAAAFLSWRDNNSNE